MNHIVTALLSLILQYGYPIIFVVVLGGELGIPVPVSTLLLAAGSFTVDNTLNIFLLIPLVTVTAILGDSIGYFFGKRFGRYLITKYFHRLGFTEKKLAAIDVFLKKWGIWCIFLSRWLLTPLGVPVNIVAGIGNYPFLRFLLFVSIGEFLWSTLYIYLGYLFGANWQTLLTYMSNAPWIFVLVAVGLVSVFIATKMRKRTR